MNSTNQTIIFNADGYKLTGTLHLPENPTSSPPPPLVIGCHGLLANRNSPKQISLAQACNAQGLAYLRFDHRGCGESQGEFHAVTSLTARCSDLTQVIATMQKNPLVGAIAALFGSSFGGTVVLAHAADHPSPTLITYAAPMDSKSISRADIRDNQGQRPDTALLTDALAFDLAPKLAKIGNVLVVHSLNDETVPVEHAHRIHAAASDPKKLVILQGGDHRMSDPNHQRLFESLFIDWLKNSNTNPTV